MTAFLIVSLWFFVNADLGCSKYTLADLPSALHYESDVVLVLVSDPLRDHELRIVDVRVELLVHWIKFDYVETRQGLIHDV